MALKDKLNKVKTVAMGAVLAATTLSSCNGGSNSEKEPVQDMLALKEVDGVDIFGNKLVLTKVNFPIYKSDEMIDDHRSLLFWGLEPNEQAKRNSKENTHAEEFVYPNGEVGGYVEVYDDGVLKANNSLVLIDGKIQVIGDKEHYERNLNRLTSLMSAERDRKKREILMQIRERKRAEMRRSAVKKSEPEQLKDTTDIQNAPDSVTEMNFVKEFSHQPETVYHEKKQPIDSVLNMLHHQEHGRN